MFIARSLALSLPLCPIGRDLADKHYDYTDDIPQSPAEWIIKSVEDKRLLQ